MRVSQRKNIGLTHDVQNSKYHLASKKPGIVSFLTNHGACSLPPYGALSASALVAIGDSLFVGPSHLPSRLVCYIGFYPWGLCQWSGGPNSHFSSQGCPCVTVGHWNLRLYIHQEPVLSVYSWRQLRNPFPPSIHSFNKQFQIEKHWFLKWQASSPR